MLDHAATASSFLFLFDRAKVQRFLSLVYWGVLKQRGRGGLQRQCGLLKRNTEGFLFYTGSRVPCYALVALGPLAVASWVVGAG